MADHRIQGINGAYLFKDWKTNLDLAAGVAIIPPATQAPPGPPSLNAHRDKVKGQFMEITIFACTIPSYFLKQC